MKSYIAVVIAVVAAMITSPAFAGRGGGGGRGGGSHSSHSGGSYYGSSHNGGSHSSGSHSGGSHSSGSHSGSGMYRSSGGSHRSYNGSPRVKHYRSSSGSHSYGAGARGTTRSSSVAATRTKYGFTPRAGSPVSVRPYEKQNGTPVQGHERTAPNNTQRDNWSSKSNVNPTNGKPGTITPTQ